MINAIHQAFLDQSLLFFPPEWIKSALVLALITVWMVIGLFTYMNYSARRLHLSLWTVSWMFYSVYLAASIGLQETPHTPLLMMVSRACIGISALFMFWGSFQLTAAKRDQRELALASVLMVIWSYVGAYRVRNEESVTLPVFILLAGAGVYTGILYMRTRRRSRGSIILGIGFLLWGVHLLGFPLAEGSQALMAGAYLTSSILALLIVVGMVVEDSAHTSEVDYRALFDSSGDAVFLLDSKTQKVVAGQSDVRHVEQAETEELVGHALLEFIRTVCRRHRRPWTPVSTPTHDKSPNRKVISPAGRMAANSPAKGARTWSIVREGPVLMFRTNARYHARGSGRSNLSWIAHANWAAPWLELSGDAEAGGAAGTVAGPGADGQRRCA